MIRVSFRLRFCCGGAGYGLAGPGGNRECRDKATEHRLIYINGRAFGTCLECGHFAEFR